MTNHISDKQLKNLKGGQRIQSESTRRIEKKAIGSGYDSIEKNRSKSKCMKRTKLAAGGAAKERLGMDK